MNNRSPNSLRVLVTGPVACFRRSEFSVDIVSYDVMPPTVARRLLDATFPLSSRRWIIDRIIVLNPIRFDWINLTTNRGERRALVLTDVSYLLEASVPVPVVDIANDMIEPPWQHSLKSVAHLGLADFAADVALLGLEEQAPVPVKPSGVIDLGWMPYDVTPRNRNLFFRASMVDGTIDLREQNPMFRAS